MNLRIPLDTAPTLMTPENSQWDCKGRNVTLFWDFSHDFHLTLPYAEE